MMSGEATEAQIAGLLMALRVRGETVDEITGKTRKVDQFIQLMKPLGLIEVVRTGVAAISRGPEALKAAALDTAEAEE
jgi:acetolactate synthase small subunit